MTPPGPSSARPAPAGEPRAPGTGLLLMLLAAMGVGALFNYGVSASSTVVIERLGVTSGQLGTVLTVVFASAAVTSVALGRAADRLSSCAQMSVIFGGSVLALTVGASATTLAGLYAAAAVAGVTQAISNPTTNRVIRSVVPAERRIGWIGVKQSGVQVAQLVASLSFPAAALALGWTGASLATAGLAAVLWAAAVAVVPPLPAPSGAVGAVPARTGRPPLPATVWFFAAIAFLTGLGMQATNAYLPLFAVESLGLSLVTGGAAAAASGVIGVASRIWWGRQMSAGHRPTTLLAGIALGSMAGVGVFLAADLARAPALLWAGAAVHGLTVLGANVVTNAGLLDAVPAEHLGRATGVNAMGMYAGFACGPLVMGLLRDLTGDFRLGFAAVGAGYALALVAVLLLLRHTDRAAAGNTA